MSEMNESPEVESIPAAARTPVAPGEPPPVNHGPRWFHRLTSVLLVIFCFELGLFLLIYPWTSAWNDNYFSWLVPGRLQMAWHAVWISPWLRGAISGVGLVNLWLAVSEVFHMFSRRHSH